MAATVPTAACRALAAQRSTCKSAAFRVPEGTRRAHLDAQTAMPASTRRCSPVVSSSGSRPSALDEQPAALEVLAQRQRAAPGAGVRGDEHAVRALVERVERDQPPARPPRRPARRRRRGARRPARPARGAAAPSSSSRHATVQSAYSSSGSGVPVHRPAAASSARAAARADGRQRVGRDGGEASRCRRGRARRARARRRGRCSAARSSSRPGGSTTCRARETATCSAERALSAGRSGHSASRIRSSATGAPRWTSRKRTSRGTVGRPHARSSTSQAPRRRREAAEQREDRGPAAGGGRARSPRAPRRPRPGSASASSALSAAPASGWPEAATAGATAARTAADGCPAKRQQLGAVAEGGLDVADDRARPPARRARAAPTASPRSRGHSARSEVRRRCRVDQAQRGRRRPARASAASPSCARTQARCTSRRATW